VTEAGAADAGEQEIPEFDWIPVLRWPGEIRWKLEDLAAVEQVIRVLKDGPAEDGAYGMCMDFLARAQMTLRQEAAGMILDAHQVAPPEEEPPPR